jgi:hypothetical protein
LKRIVVSGYDEVANVYLERFGVSTVRQKWMGRLFDGLPAADDDSVPKCSKITRDRDACTTTEIESPTAAGFLAIRRSTRPLRLIQSLRRTPRPASATPRCSRSTDPDNVLWSQRRSRNAEVFGRFGI